MPKKSKKLFLKMEYVYADDFKHAIGKRGNLFYCREITNHKNLEELTSAIGVEVNGKEWTDYEEVEETKLGY